MIPGMKILLTGQPGTGKTHSLVTIAEAGYEVFCLFTGDSGMTSATRDPRIHYHTVSPGSVSWDVLKDAARKSNQLSTEQLAKASISKGEFLQFIEVLNVCNEFIDERSGKSYGDTESWRTDRVLVLDHLSGFSKMARALIVGARTYITQPELWNAQGNLARALDKLIFDLKCHFILVTHVDGDRHELTGEVTYYPSTPELGKALRPTFSTSCSDVIFAKRKGTQFTWTTLEQNAHGMKANNITWQEDLPQDFGPLFARWKERGGVTISTETGEPL